MRTVSARLTQNSHSLFTLRSSLKRHATRDKASLALGWDGVRTADPAASQLMLAHTRADVAALNDLAQDRMREAGDLGADQLIQTERGPRAFAEGDRLMFLKNERSLGVKNGSLGTVEEINGSTLSVRLDGAGERTVRFDLKDYAALNHGYASAIHKSQGVTVDHAHFLASGGMDRDTAYVGMSRHRDSLTVHYGEDAFRDRGRLAQVLSRDRAKDTTLDYAQAFAAVRGVEPQSRRGPDPYERVKGLVDRWNELTEKRSRLIFGHQYLARKEIDGELKAVARELKDDPALGAALKEWGADLGVRRGTGLDRVLRSASVERAIDHGLGLESGLER